MSFHGYFAVENLALNDSQRDTRVQGLRSLGPTTRARPAQLCHWRTRLDGQAAIFEALFEDEVLTVEWWKVKLGALFDINHTTIDHAIASYDWGGQQTPVVTFSWGGTPYVRVALFGGTGATWQESGDACRAYLAANIDEWEDPDQP